MLFSYSKLGILSKSIKQRCEKCDAIKCQVYGGVAVPLAVVILPFGTVGSGIDPFVLVSPSGVLLRVKEEVSFSSGIVANFFNTCLSAGRRIGLL